MAQSATQKLAALLAAGWDSGIAFGDLPPELVPTDIEAAYAVQDHFLHQRHVTIGGWKVGAKSPDAPIRCAPLPKACLQESGSTCSRPASRPLALELEIAFCFGRDFAPRAALYSDEEVLGSIARMGAAIEVVISRYREWPEVPPTAQLADLLNHGALVVGETVPYQGDFPFVTPNPSFTFEGHGVINGAALNPAGDPRQLLPRLVNHATQRGIALPAGTVVTTGSYTGMHFPGDAGVASGHIPGLPPVSVTLV
ncbi:2-keto-4-pentenoate hydratase [Trinickia dinghuensis]|uniref:2-keto-4-pentenoate hydratase n=1 Tax=Trinickia dinghuensis TaxID=2291023 RepID=A0A3D8JUG2_9BURK|nr:2-keto-4-pentenoate hydratase [Trinickia dinghuensis]